MSKSQLNQFPHSVGLAPQQAQGVRAVGPLTLGFQGAAGGPLETYADDFNLEEIDGTINNIQSVYFDASQMLVQAVLIIQESGQTLILPPNSQGFLPVFAAGTMTYKVTTAGTGATIYQQLSLTFYNTPCKATIWNAAGNPPQFQASQSNAGNIALSAAVGFNVPVGKQLFIDGVDITGTGSTAGGSVLATISNLFLSPNGAAGNLFIPITVPLLPETFTFSKTFPKPFVVTTSKSPLGGIQSNQTVLTVPAMGAGQTFAAATLYYHLG